MRLLFCIIMMFLSIGHTGIESMRAIPVVSPAVAVKSYSEWKKAKVTDIETKIKTLRERLSNQDVRQLSSGKDPNLTLSKTEFESGLSHEIQNQLEQEMLTLSMSRDLTISDYFVGYLTKQTSLDAAIREVSVKLTPNEVADLMVAFAEHFFQSRTTGVKSKLRADSGQ